MEIVKYIIMGIYAIVCLALIVLIFKQSKEVTEVPETPTVPETPVVDVPADQNQPVDQKATAVKTGDSSNSEIFVCLAGLAILGGYLSTRKRFE